MHTLCKNRSNKGWFIVTGLSLLIDLDPTSHCDMGPLLVIFFIRRCCLHTFLKAFIIILFVQHLVNDHV